MPQLKNAFGGGLGANAQTSGGGSGGTKTARAGNGSPNLDVSGNGCACDSNGCIGNCSNMEQIDLENFDPLDWVKSHT